METASSGEDALQALSSAHYDAVFLDVRMPGLDGVELARVLRRFASPPALIFVSAYESAAVEAFELRALDYLLKPVAARGWRRRSRASAAAGGRRAGHARRRRPGGGTRLVRRDDILYLQAHGDYVRVVTHRRPLPRARHARRDRAALGPHGFHRVHRRFLVNLRRAVEVRPQLNGTALLFLADGAELPIARREVAELRRRLRS